MLIFSVLNYEVHIRAMQNLLLWIVITTFCVLSAQEGRGASLSSVIRSMVEPCRISPPPPPSCPGACAGALSPLPPKLLQQGAVGGQRKICGKDLTDSRHQRVGRIPKERGRRETGLIFLNKAEGLEREEVWGIHWNRRDGRKT